VAKKKKQTSLIGLIIVVALLGGGIALAMSHSPGEGGTVTAKPTEYDDSWGKLETPSASAEVTHILLSWAGKNAMVKPKDPARTQEQAKALVEKLWLDYLNDPTDENWRALQAKHNEDTEPHKVYNVPEDPLVQPFKDCALSTKVNHARYIESEFGYHLIRRQK
jgi:hypothetical protein